MALRALVANQVDVPMQTWLQFGGEFVDPPRIGLPCGQIQRFEQVRKCFDYGVALSTDGVTRSLVRPPANSYGALSTARHAATNPLASIETDLCYMSTTST
jgi:hypothetical protein